jgi:hypothetical protein
MKNFKQRSVKVDHFAMIPRADIPRSTFKIETAHKTTFNAGSLVPVFIDEILPGDSYNLHLTAFARMATPIYPLMDNLHMEHHAFFVPNRLTWDNWERFMGSQDNPNDSISYIIPQCTHSIVPAPLSIYDYLGLPTTGQSVNALSHNALPLRGYNLIWNSWYRDENLQNSLTVPTSNGPDVSTIYTLQSRGKRKDYFTSALPFVQKGNPVSFGLGGIVPVATNNQPITFSPVAGPSNMAAIVGAGLDKAVALSGTVSGSGNTPVRFGNQSGLQVDLATATATTVNNLRNSFQVQKLLERDARAGTRYVELIRGHFGVTLPDFTAQRPVFLGSSHTPININAIAQQSGTGTTGTTTPLGQLAGIGTGVSQLHFNQSFTEHGYLIILANVRADLTYQQGIRKMWSRSTRYDFYFPVFAMLGEQPVLNKEIYFQGIAADDQVFGYQERWAEYRYHPSRITGLFKSTTAGTIDGWHLAQRFTTLPTLNSTFITDNPPMERVLAVGAAANGQEFIYDSICTINATRALPMYSVPGLIDHF